MWNRIFWISILLLVTVLEESIAGKNGYESVLNIDNSPDYLMGNYISFIEDKDGMNYTQVIDAYNSGAFHSLGHERLFNKGYTESMWWFAFRLKNSLDKENKVIFSPVGASIREGILYVFDHQNQLLEKQYSGFLYGGDKRPLKSRIVSYEIHLDPGAEYLFLLYVDSRGLNTYIPFFLDHATFYWEYETYRTAIYGIVTGILLMAAITSLLFGLYLKESIYLIFTGYLLSCLILILEEDGFLHLWLYGAHAGQFSEIVIPLFVLLMSVLLLQFILRFFNINQDQMRHLRKLQTLIWISYFFSSIIIGAFFISNHYRLNQYINFSALYIALLNIMLVFLVSLYMMRTRKLLSYYMMAANAILLFGFTNYVLNLQGIVNWHPLKPNGLIFGSIFNVFIFTIGIVYRYYQIKVEREHLQSEVYNQEKKIAISIIQAQESERQRIAKDLHDDLGGLLALIKLKLEDLLLHGHNVQKILGELLKLMTQACKDVRYISHELMPQDIDEKDLKTMISEVLNILANQQKLQISYDIGELPLIPSVVKINIFRIIKELLNNIIKHSEAREADIQIFQDDLDKSLTLMISDNGKGMPTQVLGNVNMGLGLKNLQKRVDFLKGKLHIDTGVHGTTIIIIIPEKTLLSEYAETPYHS
ncbi:MAG: hypothetical protein JJU28_10250 [Cyclobacteriaceae bacterium]|nr:hypothetical protein [Cyclobacteriaceae bacterium]